MKLDRLKDLRDDENMSQKEIAELLNVAERTYSGYETGSRTIPYEALIKLAKFYNTSTDYILGITNDRHFTYEKYAALVKRLGEGKR